MKEVEVRATILVGDNRDLDELAKEIFNRLETKQGPPTTKVDIIDISGVGGSYIPSPTNFYKKDGK